MTSLTTYFLFWFLSAPAVFFTHNRQRHQQVRPPSSIQVEYRTASSEGHYRSRFVCSSTRPVAVRTLCCRKQNPVASLRVLGNRKITFQLNLPVLSPSEVRIANWICCTFGVTPCRGHWQCFRFRSTQKLLTHLLYLAALARFSSAFSEKPANNQRTRMKKIR